MNNLQYTKMVVPLHDYDEDGEDIAVMVEMEIEPYSITVKIPESASGERSESIVIINSNKIAMMENTKTGSLQVVNIEDISNMVILRCPDLETRQELIRVYMGWPKEKSR